MTGRSLMILGTASHVGKSLLVAALCRIFKQDGYRVAPFKAQNMALNSAATPEGLEIGRAQAVQAEAAGIAPSVDMNPILIKPSCDTSAQVVVAGQVWGQISAADYHQRRVEELFPLVLKSYERLAAANDIVVLEGAGSPAEINLKDHDIVNMRMARAAGAACLLVGDIDRGGVFAALLGTLELLEPEERRRVRGFAVNKFRGDRSLLQPGINMIEERIGKRCIGVINYLQDVGLDEEDSVAMEDRRSPAQIWREDVSPDRSLRVGVIALPYISNFTDFDALAAEPSVALAYLTSPCDVALADVVILPGTKQTIQDLQWLRSKAFDKAIETCASRSLILGICGGMQMLGLEVSDPEGMEGGGSARGLGMLPVKTILARDKVTVPAKARLVTPRLFGQPMPYAKASGYEIHLGITEYLDGSSPLFEISRESLGSMATADGALSGDGRVAGTYLHGLFDDDCFRHSFIAAARAASRLAPRTSVAYVTAERQRRFDRLAEHVRRSLDIDAVYGWLGQCKPVLMGGLR